MTYSPEAVRTLFDKIAAQEDQLEKHPFLRNEIPREFIRRYLGPPDIVLDAGGGTGINAILMAPLCQRVTLVLLCQLGRRPAKLGHAEDETNCPCPDRTAARTG